MGTKFVILLSEYFVKLIHVIKFPNFRQASRCHLHGSVCVEFPEDGRQMVAPNLGTL